MGVTALISEIRWKDFYAKKRLILSKFFRLVSQHTALCELRLVWSWLVTTLVNPQRRFVAVIHKTLNSQHSNASWRLKLVGQVYSSSIVPKLKDSLLKIPNGPYSDSKTSSTKLTACGLFWPRIGGTGSHKNRLFPIVGRCRQQ